MQHDGVIRIEIAVDSVRDAVAAAHAGADRIELCSRLDLDGLTPNPRDIARVKGEVGVPVMAMLRPREGAFTCEPHEFGLVLSQLEALVGAGSDGIVFGFLDAQHEVDEAICGEVLARCGEVERVFHRAFDQASGGLAAVEKLITIGCTRVLTSGHAASAVSPEGIDGIERLVRHAGGKIEVLPGGGVRASNAADLITRTGCRQVHSSARTQGRFDAMEVVRLREAVEALGRCG